LSSVSNSMKSTPLNLSAMKCSFWEFLDEANP
jgi:hypothetical protein